MNGDPIWCSDRRRFVLGGAALAGSALAGCCTVPAQSLQGLCTNAAEAFLVGPEVLKAWARSERYFDGHTHFFNAADVPVEGFLAKSVAHSIEDDTVRSLVIALAPIAAALAHIAPSPQAEMGELCMPSSANLLSAGGNTGRLDAAIAQRRTETADALYEEILRRPNEIPAIVNRATETVRGVNPNSLLLQRSPSGFSRDFVRESLSVGSGVRDETTNQIQPYSLKTLRVEDIQLAQVRSALQFVGFMLSPRHHNLRTYIQRFAAGSPKTLLSGCFGALVDFNYWLDCPAKASNMRDQVLVQEQMAFLSGGFLLPIVGYNPWVDIAENDASLNTVIWAVKEHGCVGVKIYPPMGYYPYGNDGHPLPNSTEKRPDLKTLDVKLAKLYATCDELGVPVMAHDNESNGRDIPSDQLGKAVGWQRADDLLTDLKSLHINAGHFGGALAHKDGDWTLDFVLLMQNAKRLKVYGDLGFWDELITSAEAQRRLGSILQTPVGNGTVADRTLYGSDWLMLSKTPGWESYADGVSDVLRSYDKDGSIAQRVLGTNVLECYGLVEGSGRQNIARLLAHYSAAGRPAPGWLKPLP